MNRTLAYQLTIGLTPYGQRIEAKNHPAVVQLRKDLRSANRDLKRVYELQLKDWAINGRDQQRPRRVRLTLMIRGRLGPNSQYASLYSKGGPLWRFSSQDIRLEHSSRADLYVHERAEYTF